MSISGKFSQIFVWAKPTILGSSLSIRTTLLCSILLTISPSVIQAKEPSLRSQEDSHSLTYNYYLATKGKNQDLPTLINKQANAASDSPHGRQSSPNFPFNHFSAIGSSLAAQLVSQEISPEESTRPHAQEESFEEVSPYIIHEPAHRDDGGNRITSSPAPHTQEIDEIPLETSASPKDPGPSQGFAATSPAEMAPPSFPLFPLEGNHWPSSLHDHDQNQTEAEEDDKQGAQDFPLVQNLTFPDETSSQLFSARFSRVLDESWEAATSSPKSPYGSIPLVLNDAVEKNLEYFQYGIPERFQSYLDRFHHYRELVEPIFHEYGIPTELMYLSLVESGFNPRAFSRARASGPWQFMKGTGRMYGLQVDWYLDERRDPIKSTVAAAHHLRDLYDRFGSWPLALAAYNAGEGKISRAIRKTGTRDFWKIRRTRHIRRETKEYVPRFIAATLIAKNPTAYGFSAPFGVSHEFEEVLVTKQVNFSAINEKTGISIEELKRLNPELRRSIVPQKGGSGYHLKVPIGMASLIEEHQDTMTAWTQPPPPPTEWYRVRQGDSLSVVARRYRMKVSALKAMNNLRSNVIRVGDRLRVRGGDEDYADDQMTFYRVRYGDSLGTIANRFQTSIQTLMQLNNLRNSLIHPGDRLRIKGQVQKANKQTGDSKWYRVRRGDSLWSIAEQFSLSVRDLQALNNLSSSIIQAGHLLMISR